MFDQDLIAQVVAAGGLKIDEIAVPTRYFEEASSVGFKRSVVYGLSTLRVVARYLLHRTGLRRSAKLRPAPLLERAPSRLTMRSSAAASAGRPSGVAISVVALALVVRTVDVGGGLGDAQDRRPAMDRAAGRLRRRRRRCCGPSAGGCCWRRSRRCRTSTTLASLLVGYLANNVLPARLGEVVRSHDLGRRGRASAGSMILGTIVIERVVDTMVVVAIAAIAILVLSVRGIVASAVLVGLALTALLVVGVAVGIYAHRLPGADRVAALPRPVAAGAARSWCGCATGWRSRSDPRAMGGAIVLSLASWSCTVLAFAAAAQAVGVEPTIGQAALLAAGTNLATAIPAGPGYVGTFELATVTIAASVGIAAESALAFAILVHVATLADDLHRRRGRAAVRRPRRSPGVRAAAAAVPGADAEPEARR